MGLMWRQFIEEIQQQWEEPINNSCTTQSFLQQVVRLESCLSRKIICHYRVYAGKGLTQISTQNFKIMDLMDL